MTFALSSRSEGNTMGAWGFLAFDNDDANDWAASLEKTADLSMVDSAFDKVEIADLYLEAPDASIALAACEVLARLRGRVGYQNAYTAAVDRWVAAHPMVPSPELLARASWVIDVILGPQSELRELWEGADAKSWLASVEDLRRRLRD
jgi:hypothetical protein